MYETYKGCANPEYCDKPIVDNHDMRRACELKSGTHYCKTCTGDYCNGAEFGDEPGPKSPKNGAILNSNNALWAILGGLMVMVGGWETKKKTQGYQMKF